MQKNYTRISISYSASITDTIHSFSINSRRQHTLLAKRTTSGVIKLRSLISGNSLIEFRLKIILV